MSQTPPPPPPRAETSTENVYLNTLATIGGLALGVGLVLAIAGMAHEPDYDSSQATGDNLLIAGSGLFGLGVAMTVAWLVVSALIQDRRRESRDDD